MSKSSKPDELQRLAGISAAGGSPCPVLQNFVALLYHTQDEPCQPYVARVRDEMETLKEKLVATIAE